MNEKNNKVSNGIGFCSLLGIVFIVLKLCKVITWGWGWVLAPLWLPTVLVIAFYVLVFVAALIWRQVRLHKYNKSLKGNEKRKRG